MSEVTKPIILDETLQRIAVATEALAADAMYGPWATMDDQYFPSLMQEVDAGTLSLTSDLGWAEGDIRTVRLTDGTSIDIVLSDPGHYTLTTPKASGKTTCDFTLIMKDCHTTTRQMNSSATSSGSWPNCAMRTYLNSTFKNMLPDGLKSILKSFVVVTGQYGSGSQSGGSNVTSNDYLALPAEKEIFGSATYSTNTEAYALTQLNYYKVAANRIKTVDGTASNWWERSPFYSNSLSFCSVYTNGSAHNDNADYSYGVSWLGCI